MQTKLKDDHRKWLWGFLAVTMMSQLYFVQELLAVFALFALGFAAIAYERQAIQPCLQQRLQALAGSLTSSDGQWRAMPEHFYDAAIQQTVAFAPA